MPSLDLRTAGPQRQLAVLAVAVAIASATVGWLLLRSDGAPPGVSGDPVLLSQGELERFAAGADGPVYWAGPKPGYAYELTTREGRTYVRYVPAGVTAGDRAARFLTVGTYLDRDSYANLRRAARDERAVSSELERDGLVVYAVERPTNVYLAYPRKHFQVEVFAPGRDTARRLVLGAAVEPIR